MEAWAFNRTPSLMLMVGEAEERERFAYAMQRAMRERPDLSERQLAKNMGIDPRKVAAWRKGKSLPTLYEAARLAKELRVDEDLFRNPPEVPAQPPEPYYPIEKYLLDKASVEGQNRVARRLAGTEPNAPAQKPERPPRSTATGRG